MAADGEPIEAGTLYIAPPDRHLLAKEGAPAHLLATKGPRKNHCRPSVGALFRSAAVAFGPRTVGIVLTGMLHDDTARLEFIKRCGGLAIVQDPAEAEFPSMPQSALQNVAIDYVVPLARMGQLLDEILGTPISHRADIPDDLKREAAIAEKVVSLGTADEAGQLGHLVPLTCPDCGGNLRELDHSNVQRFRCHTGHALTADALLLNSQQTMREILWLALRMMDERQNLLGSMAARGEGWYSQQKAERLEEITEHINRLRRFLLNGSNGAPVAQAQS